MKMVFRNLAQTPSIFKPMSGKQLMEMLGSSGRGCGGGGGEKAYYGRCCEEDLEEEEDDDRVK